MLAPLSSSHSLVPFISCAGTDLPLRFADQFSPLSLGPGRERPWTDGTILRLPIRPGGMEGVEEMVEQLRRHAAASLLFLSSMESVRGWGHVHMCMYR